MTATRTSPASFCRHKFFCLLFSVLLLDRDNTSWAFRPTCLRSPRRVSCAKSLAAGFGTPSKNKDQRKKLRSVSGNHAGAGSKVLRNAALNFDRLRKEHEGCGADVYLRSPLNSATTFWFVGKVSFDPTQGANAIAACISQKRIILEYAKLELRPQNFGGKYATSLELWLAPPDSEMDVVRNEVCLERVLGGMKDLPDEFDVEHVGFNPEIYVGDERSDGGLRVERNEEGKPTNQVFDINQSA